MSKKGDNNEHGTLFNVSKFIKPNAERPVLFVKGDVCKPYEYRCKDCKQLRLSFVVSNKCSNCGSTNIVKGNIGTL